MTAKTRRIIVSLGIAVGVFCIVGATGFADRAIGVLSIAGALIFLSFTRRRS